MASGIPRLTTYKSHCSNSSCRRGVIPNGRAWESRSAFQGWPEQRRQLLVTPWAWVSLGCRVSASYNSPRFFSAAQPGRLCVRLWVRCTSAPHPFILELHSSLCRPQQHKRASKDKWLWAWVRGSAAGRGWRFGRTIFDAVWKAVIENDPVCAVLQGRLPWQGPSHHHPPVGGYRKCQDRWNLGKVVFLECTSKT